jgi:hypothetical protein
MIKAISVYIHEFYRKNLFRFQDCKRHYGAMSAPDILSEASWLLGSTQGLPFQLVFQRYYAIFETMTERAVCSAGFDNDHRMQFINEAIAVKEEMLRRGPSGERERLARLLGDTCKRIKVAGRYKKAGDIIRDSVLNYPGPFAARGVIVHPGSARMQ